MRSSRRSGRRATFTLTSAPASGTGARSGFRYTVVGSGTPRSNVSFEYADESDPGPYPIPANVQIEGGSDAHAILVDRDACKLYELFALSGSRAAAGTPARARSGPSPRTGCALRGGPPPTRRACRFFPGLARYDEVALGRIPHALRFTVSRTRRAYVCPARHFASSLTDPALPPMGLRFRLKSGYDISGFPPQARVVLQALKEYGMMVADNGSTGSSAAPRIHAGRTISCTRSTGCPGRLSRSSTLVLDRDRRIGLRVVPPDGSVSRQIATRDVLREGAP